MASSSSRRGGRRKRLTSDLQRSPLRLVNNRSRLDHHVDRPRGECVTEDIFDRLQAPPSQHAPSVSGPFPLLPHTVSSISPDPVTYLTGRRRVRGNRIDQCPYWLFSSWNRLPPPPPRPEDYRQRRWAAIAEKYGGRYGIEGLRFIAGVVSTRYSISVNKRAE